MVCSLLLNQRIHTFTVPLDDTLVRIEGCVGENRSIKGFERNLG